MSIGYGSDPLMWTKECAEEVEQAIDAERYWPRPVPVSERLPELDVRVLAAAPDQWDGWQIVQRNGYMAKANEDEGNPHYSHWVDDVDIVVKRITHWLPLPPKPE